MKVSWDKMETALTVIILCVTAYLLTGGNGLVILAVGGLSWFLLGRR